MTKQVKGSNQVDQIEHIDDIGAKAVTPSILSQGKVITDNISLAWTSTQKACLIRMEVAANTYVAFRAADDSDVTGNVAVDVSSSPAIKLVDAGVYILRVPKNKPMIRASANPTRIELLDC